MNLKKLVSILLAVNFSFYNLSYGSEICFNLQEGKEILASIKECQVLKEILRKQDELIKNLEEQNNLLRKQIELYQEAMNLQKHKSEILEVALKEEQKKNRLNIFEKGKLFGYGLAVGFLLGIFLIGK